MMAPKGAPMKKKIKQLRERVIFLCQSASCFRILLSASVENVVTAGTPAPMLPHNIRLISHEPYGHGAAVPHYSPDCIG